MIYKSELGYLKEQLKLSPLYAKIQGNHSRLFRELPSRRTLNRLFTYEDGTIMRKDNGKVYGKGSNDSVSIPKVGSFPCCRVIWSMHNGRIPYFKVIDREDRDRFNNEECNLRPPSVGENVKNSLPPGKTRATPVLGVTLLASGQYKVRFRCASSLSMSAAGCRILERKRRIFPNYTRTFNSFTDAVSYRNEASEEIESLYGFAINNAQQ